MKRKRGTQGDDATPDLGRGGSRKKRNDSKKGDLSSANTKNNTSDERPLKSTLQTLPRKLRDMIYDFVAATEERIVLGRRMVEAEKKNNKYDECFKQAVTLHPLSMTCHQFRDEFQDVHFAAVGPRWILLVNNFDLEQLSAFDMYIVQEHLAVSHDPEFGH